ncbi:MAG: Hsp20/alpha crystallin family protein [Pseudomonadota bacterium]
MSFFPSLFGQRKRDPAILKNEMDKVFDSFFHDWPAAFTGKSNGMLFSPAVDMAETDESLEISAEIPDMNKEDINLELHGDHLMISGEHKFEREEEKEKGYHFVERHHGSFKRVLPLPFSVPDDADIKASYDKGVLKVLIPKTEIKSVFPKQEGLLPLFF